MILANGCNITKSEKFKGVWILSVPTVYRFFYLCIFLVLFYDACLFFGQDFFLFCSFLVSTVQLSSWIEKNELQISRDW